MERIDLSPKNDACVFLLVPSCNRATKCELTTVDGELLPSVYSLTVWRDKKVFTIHITDKENILKFRRVRLYHEGSQINLSVPEDNFVDSQWVYLLDITSENENEFKFEDKNSICASFLQICLENSGSNNVNSDSVLAILRTARSVKADLESIFAINMLKMHPTVSNALSLILSVELHQENSQKEEHALNLLPALLDNSPVLVDDLTLLRLMLENLPCHAMNYHQQLHLFCFLCDSTKIQNSAYAAVNILLSRLLPSILSNIGVTLNRLLKLPTISDWLAKKVIDKSVNALLDVDPDAMFVSLSAMLEFACRHRVDVDRSKIVATVRQFVYRHNRNADAIHFLSSISVDYAKFEPCRLVISELAAILFNDTTICLDLSGHELCKVVERIHSQFTVSTEALCRLVERLQELSNDGLSALLLLLARSFADETSVLCFTAAAKRLDKDMNLLIELFVVAKYKPNTTRVLDGCFASFSMTMLLELAAESNKLDALSHSSFLSLLQKMQQTLQSELKHLGSMVEDRVDEFNAKIQNYLSLKPGRSLQTKLALHAVCVTFLGDPERPRDVLHKAWQPLLTLPGHPPKLEAISFEELYRKSSKATEILQVLFGRICDQSITVQEVRELISYADVIRQLQSCVSGKDIAKLLAQAERTIGDFEEKVKQISSFVYDWYRPIATNTEYGSVQKRLAEITSYDHMSILVITNNNPHDIVRPLPVGLIQSLYECRDSVVIKTVWVHCASRNRQDLVKIAGWQGAFTDRVKELAEKLTSKRLNFKTVEDYFRSSTIEQIQAEISHIARYSNVSLSTSAEIAATIQKAIQFMITRDSLEALLDIGVHTRLQDESWQQLKLTVQRLKVPSDFTLDEFMKMVNSILIMKLSDDNANTLKKIVASSRLLQWMTANQELIADLSSEIEILQTQSNDKTNLLADLEAIKHVFGSLMIFGSPKLVSFQEFVELVQRHAHLLTRELGEQVTTTEVRILEIEEILQELRSHNASIGFLKKINDFLNADIQFAADSQHEPTLQLIQNDKQILGKSGISALIKQMSLSDQQTDESNELLKTLLQCVKLHRALKNLHHAFHFNFYSYAVRVKINEVAKKSDAALFHLESEFESWQKEVKRVRSKFYCMNILTLRELNILLADIQRKRSQFIFGLQLQSLNNTDPPEIPTWNIPDRCATGLPTSKIVTPTELLTRLAEYLTAKYRPLGTVERKEVFGIRLFTVPSATDLSVCLLSIYIKYAERMPTIDEVLLCSPVTTIEDVVMFCNRIILASKSLNKLYTCVAIDRLVAPVRTKLLKSLQKLKQDAALAISVLTEDREMALPFAIPQPCPVLGLQQIKDAVNSHLKSKSIRARVVTSDSPGAGKTHHIKTSFKTTSVPVYPSTDLTMLIKHFNSYPKKSWHIDILHSTNEASQYAMRKSSLLQMYGGGRTSRIHEDVADFLLKIIIFGRINDSAGNIFHLLHNSELCIEYNRSISPLDKLHVQKMPAILSLLESSTIRTDPLSFEPNKVAPLLQAYPAATSLQISSFLKFTNHAPGLQVQEQQVLANFAMRLFFRSEALRWKSLDQLILPLKAKGSLLQVALQASSSVKSPMMDLTGTEEQIKSSVRTVFPSIRMNDPEFSYTPDNVCKMILIWTLLQCKIPVLIMGETGCGKTYLMQQLAKAFGVRFESFEVHGDTSEEAIKTFMGEKVKEPKQPILVFFDEINATPAIGLFKELVCNRTLRGKPIAETILIAAACNPYRKKNLRSIQGVVHLSDVCRVPRGYKQAPFSDLVYQVHPMPESMMQYCLDFEGLGSAEERIYINTMAQHLLPSLADYKQTLCKLIFASHEVIRRHSDYSAVSLRDVEKCLSLTVWFDQILKYDQCPFSHPFPRKLSCVASLFVVFYCRLTPYGRQTYCHELAKISELECSADDLVKMYNSLIDGFIKCFELDSDIVPSFTVRENLFLEFVCIMNKMPLFIIGYPGTSKSLTIRTLLHQIRGSRSKHRFFQQFPKLQGFFIQGAPTVNAETILECFNLAGEFQTRTNDSFISVVVIEEVGLIELSTELSLKVLHELLDKRNVAFVGLTNWVLDQAKMNRSVTLITTFPRKQEIIELGRWALKNTQDPTIINFLTTAADIFFERWSQDTSDISLRDYYYFAWNLLHRLETNGVVTEVDFHNALAKNFGHKAIGNSSAPSKIAPILENINDRTARHLLIETPSATQVITLLHDAVVQSNRDVQVLRGGYFPDDRSSWMAQQFFKSIKEALVHGSVLILYQMDNILDSLLEVLNKRYLKVGAVYYTRIAFGIHTETCRINPNLRIIIVAEGSSRFSAPLLSRVEKHLLVPSDFTTYQANNTILKKAQEWIQLYLSYVSATNETIALQDALVGYHVHYLESLINTSNSSNSFSESLKTQLLKMFTAEFQLLLALARPKVSKRNPEVEHHLTRLFSGDLQIGTFEECFAREQGKQSLNIIFTYSKDIPMNVKADSIALSSFQTQHHFLATLKIRSGSATNVIISCSLLQFEHQIIDFIQAECESLHKSHPIQYFIIVEMDQTPLPVFFRAKWQYLFMDSLQLSSTCAISRASQHTWLQYFRATQHNQPMSSFCMSNLLNLVGDLLYSQCSAEVITKAVYDILSSTEASKVFDLIQTVAEKLCNSDRNWLNEFQQQNKRQKFRRHCSMYQQLALAVSQKLIRHSAWVLAHFGQNNAFEVLNLKDPEHQALFSAVFDQVAKKILNRVETSLLSMPDLQSDFKYSFLFSSMIFELCDSFANQQMDDSQYAQLCFTALPPLRNSTRQSILESYLKDFSHLTNNHDPHCDALVTLKIVKAYLRDKPYVYYRTKLIQCLTYVRRRTLSIPDLHLAMRQLQGIIRSISILVRIHSAKIIPHGELPFLALIQQTVRNSLQSLIDQEEDSQDFLSSLHPIQQLFLSPMLAIDSDTCALIQFARLSYITLQHFRKDELERVKNHLAVLCQNDCLSDEFWQEVLKVYSMHSAWAVSIITSVCLQRVKESLLSKDETEAAVANLRKYLAFAIESENLPQRFVIQLYDFANTLRNSPVWHQLRVAINRSMEKVHRKELDKSGLDLVTFGLYQISYAKHLESSGWKTAELNTVDNPSSDFISWLEMNTKFILLLNEAAEDVVDNKLTSPTVQKALALLSPRLQLFKAYRFYLLKAIYHDVGDEPDFFAIVERNSVQKILPWILEFPDIIAKQEFKEFGAVYQSYRENSSTQERVSSSILQAFKAINQRKQSENLGNALLAKIIQRSSPAERQVINALSSNLVQTYLKPQSNRSADQMRIQLIMHVVALALANPSSLLHSLLLAPQASRANFLPAMPENFLAAIRTGEGVTQLWRCQCGFTYGIGNCGQPMATGHCPQCNRVIGGNDHAPAAGQTPIRLNSTEPYLKGLVGRLLGTTEALTNLAPACAHFLQLLIHCTCFASVLFNYSTPQQLAQSFTEDIPANPMDYLNNAIDHNITALSHSFNQSPTITHDYLHCILYQLYQRNLGVCIPEAALATVNDKNTWETHFKAIFNSVLASIVPRIQEMNAIINEYQRTSAQVIQELRQNISRSQFTVNYRQEMLPHLFYWRPGFDLRAFESFFPNQIDQYQLLKLTMAKKDTINLCSKLFSLISLAKMLHQLLSGVKSEDEILATTIGQFMNVPDFATQFTRAKECWDAVRQHINRFECEQFQLPEISEESSVRVLLYVPDSSNLIKLVIEHLCNLHNDVINDYWRVRGKEAQAPINVLDAQSFDMLATNDVNAIIQWIVKENEEQFIGYPANQSWSLQSIEQNLEKTIFGFKPSLFVDFKRLEFIPKPAEEDKFRPINSTDIEIPQAPLTQDLVTVTKTMSILEAEKCLLDLRSIVSVCKSIKNWGGHMTVSDVVKAVRGQSNELYARIPLSQLVSFQSALMNRLQKDPLDLVLHDYRTPLTNEEKRLLAEVLPKLNLQEFADQLRQYILMLLINAESDYLPKAEDTLKVHLPQMDEISDLLQAQIELLFPDSIKLKHALDLLLYCEKMLL